MSIREKLINLGIERGFDKKEIEEFVNKMPFKMFEKVSEFNEYKEEFKKYFGLSIHHDRDLILAKYLFIDFMDIFEKL